MHDLSRTQLQHVAFHQVTYCSPKARQSLRLHGMSVETLFSRKSSDLRKMGFSEKMCAQISRGWEHLADEELERCSRQNVRLLFRDSEQYPPLLREIYDPPEYLYALGDTEIVTGANLAVVGSRRGTDYGRNCVNGLVPQLAEAGLTIVSGMAYGIDSMAHRAVLDCGGKTVGINAGGLLNLYPAGNRSLIHAILDRGCILSEFPMAVVARPFFFPIRNRIIAGLSRAVLVVEAALRSGSLITARLAIEQNRDVFAVPGPIHSALSRGCNYLISQGARLVSNSRDILEEFGLQIDNNTTAAAQKLSRKETTLLDLMEQNAVLSIDHFVEMLDWSVADIASTLMELVLKDLVCEEFGAYRKR